MVLGDIDIPKKNLFPLDVQSQAVVAKGHVLQLKGCREGAHLPQRKLGGMQDAVGEVAVVKGIPGAQHHGDLLGADRADARLHHAPDVDRIVRQIGAAVGVKRHVVFALERELLTLGCAMLSSR